MNDKNPYRDFGLVEPDVAAGISGVEFLNRLLDSTYPAPPFSESADMWIADCEVGRVVFEGQPSRRFYRYSHGVRRGILPDHGRSQKALTCTPST